MPNILEAKTNENEELYNSTKKKLEGRIGVANGEYSSLLNDFRSQTSYIEKDTMLSKEGKIQKVSEIRDRFIDKVNVKSLDHYDSLQKQLNIALLEDEERKLKNFKGLNADMMPQLMYVNSMINSISSLTDVDLLGDVFNYACEEGNFSDELINMIYLKARNLVNNDAPVQEVESNNENAIERGKNRSKINIIISQIKKYKTNYTDDLNLLKKSFATGFNQRKYPSSLYIQRDPKSDFIIPLNLQDTNTNPWNR